MRWRFFLPLIFLLALSLGSCMSFFRGPKVALTCEQIVWLQQHIGVTTSPEMIQKSVGNAFSLPPEAVWVIHEAVNEADEMAYVRWLDQRRLAFVIHLNTQREAIRVDIVNFHISGNDLLACLGQPAQYYADASWIEPGPVRNIYLFFPQQGIMANGGQVFRGKGTAELKQIPGVDDQFPFEYLTIVKPESVEQLVAEVWGDYGRVMQQKLKPWPGEWAKMEIPPFPE